MKAIYRLLLALLILLQPASLYADDLRVVVGMSEDKDSDKELSRRVAIACSEAVVQSKGFRYISPTETVKIITEDEKIVVDKVVDLEKEYGDENSEYLRKMSEPYKNKSFDNFFKMLASIDIMISGTVQRNGPLVRIELMMNNGRNQRQYDVTVECEESRLNAEVRKKVERLLKNISGPLKVYADRLVDEKESIVTYMVRVAGNADIMVEMDYTGDRPDPKIQRVGILPPAGIDKNGATKYQVKSEEGQPIDIEFTFKGGKMDSVRVDTPIPDPLNKTKQSEILTIKSKAGYLLKFDFMWDKGEMQHVKLYPALNPFGDYDE